MGLRDWPAQDVGALKGVPYRMRQTRLGAVLAIALTVSGCAGLENGGAFQSAGASGSEAVKVAQAAYQSGDYEQAAVLFERASRDNLKSAPAFIGLGRSYIALGQNIRAENALERAHDIAPRNTEALTELGFLALTRKQPRKAIEHYDAALRIDRRNLPALTGKAVSLDFLSRHTEAQAVYQDALTWYPTDFALLANYGLSLVLAGRIGEGQRLLEELNSDQPRGGAVRENLALAYVLDGRETDARTLLSITQSPGQIDEIITYYRRIRADYRAGKPIGYMVFN